MVEHSYSAGGVVVGPGGLVALTHQDGVVWSLPKGRLEPGESARAAAEREIMEETGITKLEFIKDLGTYSRFKISKDGKNEDKTVKKTITLFLYETSENELKPTDPAHPEAKWVESDKVANTLTNPKDATYFKSILPEVKKYL
jgi:ADP-ribose pyrophosphatase YjhB (NUDIX family)